jgi:Asp-tRNA(Asn)/Glu-tRNA(Gln) amidotransferase A subunit family amidase
MPEMDVTFKSVKELSALITSKEVSVTEVTKAYLERIERLQSRLNALYHHLPRRGLELGASHGRIFGPGKPGKQAAFRDTGGFERPD